MRWSWWTKVSLAGLTAFAVSSSPASAAPSVADALKLQPLQNKDVDCDRPSGDALADLSVEPIKEGDIAGWKVASSSGKLYRRFIDTNGDNKLDQWCYYKDGVEIYRDIDGDFNGKADQYRWMGPSGIRWGLDRNEDGDIDAWKVISPEEVSAEVVAAIRDGDKNRFARLLITAAELKDLGMNEERQKMVLDKLKDAETRFENAVRKNKDLAAGAQWIHFGGNRPSVVPQGNEGMTKDVYLYDNVGAVIQRGDDHAQIMIGTLVQVDQGWRLLDVPESLGGASDSSMFMSAGLRNDDDGSAVEGMSAQVRELVTQLNTLDEQYAAATTDRQRTALHNQRADLLQKLINISKDNEREAWIRQFADLISAAAQTGGYNEGVDRLNKLVEELKDQRANADTLAYVIFRTMSAEYAIEVTTPDADFAKIQDAWLKKLEAFVSTYPKSPDAAEAVLQLAIAKEFAGDEKEAIVWYGRISSEFASSPIAAKAIGAKRRLESVGKSIQIEGATLDGRSASLSQLQGKVVLVHYWATWCEPCKKDMDLLKSLQAKYARNGFALLGVNLDSVKEDAEQFLKTNRLPWPQLHEPGGLDSRLANELGILSLPTMILLDERGKVVNRSIHSRELDDELAKLIRKRR